MLSFPGIWKQLQALRVVVDGTHRNTDKLLNGKLTDNDSTPRHYIYYMYIYIYCTYIYIYISTKDRCERSSSDQATESKKTAFQLKRRQMSSLRFFWVLQVMMWCLGLNFTVRFCWWILAGVIGWGVALVVGIFCPNV